MAGRALLALMLGALQPAGQQDPGQDLCAAFHACFSQHQQDIEPKSKPMMVAVEGPAPYTSYSITSGFWGATLVLAGKDDCSDTVKLQPYCSGNVVKVRRSPCSGNCGKGGTCADGNIFDKLLPRQEREAGKLTSDGTHLHVNGARMCLLTGGLSTDGDLAFNGKLNVSEKKSQPPYVLIFSLVVLGVLGAYAAVRRRS